MGGFDSSRTGIDACRASDQNYEVSLKTGLCVKRRPMPLPRYSFGICAQGEYIFVVGGLDQVTQEDFG